MQGFLLVDIETSIFDTPSDSTTNKEEPPSLKPPVSTAVPRSL